jgi:hypothetical protein
MKKLMLSVVFMFILAIYGIAQEVETKNRNSLIAWLAAHSDPDTST